MPDTHIPRPLTELIGREGDLAALEAALETESLIAVTGPPGVGKSRLLLALARRLDEGSRSLRVLWVTPEPDASRDRVLTDIALALDIALMSRDTVVEVVGRALTETPTVLLLDGVDRAHDALTEVLETWLERGEALRIVVGARGAPHGTTAHVRLLEPLALGAEGPARRLFDQRLVEGGGFLDGHDDTTPEIVAHLDGVPMAIELAAAHAALVGVEEVLRMTRDDPSALLDHEVPATRAGRPALLRAVIARSWQTLGPRARALLAAVSCFRGSFDPLDVRALVESAGDAEQALDELCRRSLVRPAESTASEPAAADEESPHSRRSFALLGPVRAFAREALAERDDAETLRRRWANHMAQWVRPLAVDLDGPNARRALKRLRRRRPELAALVEDYASVTSARDRCWAALALGEVTTTEQGSRLAIDHFRTALILAHETGASDLSLLVAARLARLLFNTDQHTEAAELLDAERGRWGGSVESSETPLGQRAHEHVEYEDLRLALKSDPAEAIARIEEIEMRRSRDGGAPTDIDGRLHVAHALAGLKLGQVAGASERLDEAIPILEVHAPPTTLSWALDIRATVALWAERPHRALADIQRSVELARSLGPRHVRLLGGLRTLGWVLGDLRRSDALDAVDEASELAYILGQQEERRHLALLRACIEADRGELERARDQLTGLLAESRVAGDESVRLRARFGRADVDRRRGRLACALSDLDVAHEIACAAETTERTWFLIIEATRAALLAEMGELERAGALAETAERRLDEIDVEWAIVHVRLQLACVAWLSGDMELVSALETLADVLAPREDGRVLWSSSMAARSSARPLIRLVTEGDPDLQLKAAAPDDETIVWRTDTQRFRVGEHAWFDFGRRHLLERLFIGLIERRESEPGGAVRSDELLEIGWPGETILAEAASNRLYKSLSQLRRLPGVRDALQTVDDGWRIDPALFVLRLPLE